MPCPTCGAMTQREIAAPGILSEFCPCGHRQWYFKHGEKWLCELDHRRKLQVTVNCDECHKDYTIPCAIPESYKCCPACSEKKQKILFVNLSAVRRAAQKKATKHSPWGIFGLWGKKK